MLWLCCSRTGLQPGLNRLQSSGCEQAAHKGLRLLFNPMLCMRSSRNEPAPLRGMTHHLSGSQHPTGTSVTEW